MQDSTADMESIARILASFHLGMDVGCAAVQVRNAIPETRVMIVLSRRQGFLFVRWMVVEESQLSDECTTIANRKQG